jgi:hypothetical protein
MEEKKRRDYFIAPSIAGETLSGMGFGPWFLDLGRR